MSVTIVWFGFVWYGDHRDLHVLTDSYPTRRSSDLLVHSQNLRAVAHGVNTYGQLGATLDAGFDYPDGAAVVASVETPRGTYNFRPARRSEEHTSELKSLMRISYAVFRLIKNKIMIYTIRLITSQLNYMQARL